MKNWWVLIIIIFLLTGAFWLGFKAHARFRPCIVDRDTIKIYDTVEHKVPDTIPFYYAKIDSVKYRDKHWMDSVIKANKVDTAAILADYYAIHYYGRDWYDIDTVKNDTLIHIRLDDAITENMPIDNNFSYRYYKPQTIINNSVTNVSYSSYLYGTLTLPIPDTKFASLGLSYASGRGLIGVGYMPFNKGVSLTGGFKLVRFRQR
jgi:hypothetical protein